jgi:hypothetical protein
MPQLLQVSPPLPQALAVGVVTQVLPLQQPVQPLFELQVQTPFRHTVPVGQVWPQLPQLFLSVKSFRHFPPQQVWPASHFSLQPPQLLTSVWVLTHVPLQQVVPA